MEKRNSVPFFLCICFHIPFEKNKRGGNDMEFYPTPKTLLDQIFKGANWKRIETVLEPSAGKGDIVEYIHQQDSEIDIDCIEIEENLQHILTGKGHRLVWDDFLSYQTPKHYDLIVMNPPFSTGDEHLLKALEMQKRWRNDFVHPECRNAEKPMVFATQGITAETEVISS